MNQNVTKKQVRRALQFLSVKPFITVSSIFPSPPRSLLPHTLNIHNKRLSHGNRRNSSRFFFSFQRDIENITQLRVKILETHPVPRGMCNLLQHFGWSNRALNPAVLCPAVKSLTVPLPDTNPHCTHLYCHYKATSTSKKWSD